MKCQEQNTLKVFKTKTTCVHPFFVEIPWSPSIMYRKASKTELQASLMVLTST